MFSTEMQMKLDPSLKATILSKYVKINFQNFLIFIYSIRVNESLITIDFISLSAPIYYCDILINIKKQFSLYLFYLYYIIQGISF